jgi:hypothetical protein
VPVQLLLRRMLAAQLTERNHVRLAALQGKNKQAKAR